MKKAMAFSPIFRVLIATGLISGGRVCRESMVYLRPSMMRLPPKSEDLMPCLFASFTTFCSVTRLLFVSLLESSFK